LFATFTDAKLLIIFLSHDKRSDSVGRKPTPIRDAFPGINGKIDAVFQHEGE